MPPVAKHLPDRRTCRHECDSMMVNRPDRGFITSEVMDDDPDTEHALGVASRKENEMDATQLVERYLDTWNETDADARRAAVAEIWADDGRYVDPMVDV